MSRHYYDSIESWRLFLPWSVRRQLLGAAGIAPLAPWIQAYEPQVTADGRLRLYAAVSQDHRTRLCGSWVRWEPSRLVEVPTADWEPLPRLMSALNLAVTPEHARDYTAGRIYGGGQPRVMEVLVDPDTDDLLPWPLNPEARARRALVIREVDVDGQPVAGGETR